MKQKTAKTVASVWTVLYLILLPILSYMAALAGLMLYDPAQLPWTGYALLFTFFWVPLSLPISIYWMWSAYFKGQYSRIHFAYLLPFAVLVLVLLIAPLLQYL